MNKSTQPQPDNNSAARSANRAIVLGPVREFLYAQATTGNPADKLPSEWSLSKQFGISRRVARHALQSLVRDGLVVVRQGGGYFIREKIDKPKRNPQKAQVGLVTFGPHLQTRSHTIELMAQALAAQNMEETVFNLRSASEAPALLRDNPDIDYFVLLSVSPAVQHFFAGQSKPTIVLGNTYADLGLPCVWMNELETTRQATTALLDQTSGPIVLMQMKIPNLGLERQRLGFRFAHHERQLRLPRGHVIRVRPDGRALKAALAQVKRIMPRAILFSAPSLLAGMVQAGLKLDDPAHPITPMLLATDFKNEVDFPVSHIASDVLKEVKDVAGMINRLASGSSLEQRIIPIDWRLHWQ